MPQIATIVVANLSEWAKGARIMEDENIKWLKVQTASKSGCNRRTTDRKLESAEEVDENDSLRLALRFSSSGGRTSHGSVTELSSEMQEKMTSEKLPTRPIWPRVSSDAKSGDAS